MDLKAAFMALGDSMSQAAARFMNFSLRFGLDSNVPVERRKAVMAPKPGDYFPQKIDPDASRISGIHSRIFLWPSQYACSLGMDYRSAEDCEFLHRTVPFPDLPRFAGNKLRRIPVLVHLICKENYHEFR